MIKILSNHFLEAKVVHGDVHEMVCKVQYDFKFEDQVISLKNWIHQECTWVQTTVKNNGNMDHFYAKIILIILRTKFMIRSFFCIKDDSYCHVWKMYACSL